MEQLLRIVNGQESVAEELDMTTLLIAIFQYGKSVSSSWSRYDRRFNEANPKPARSLLTPDMRKLAARYSTEFAVYLARRQRRLGRGERGERRERRDPGDAGNTGSAGSSAAAEE